MQDEVQEDKAMAATHSQVWRIVVREVRSIPLISYSSGVRHKAGARAIGRAR